MISIYKAVLTRHFEVWTTDNSVFFTSSYFKTPYSDMGHFHTPLKLSFVSREQGEISLYLSLAAHLRLRSPQAKRSITGKPFHISMCKSKEEHTDCTMTKTQSQLT